MKSNTHYDLSIIGGGIIGIWAALLAKQTHPNLSILLIDQSLIGSGATHYSLGLNYLYGDTEEKKELSQLSFAHWQAALLRLPNLSMRKVPFYINQSLNDWAYIASAEAVTLELCSYLRTKNNLSFLEGIKVLAIEPSEKEWVIKTSIQEDIRTQKIILALGPWLPSFLSSFASDFGNQFKIRNKKIVSFHFQGLLSDNEGVSFWPDAPAFLAADFQKNRTLFSFSSEEWDCTPSIDQLYITEQDKKKGFEILNKYSKIDLSHFCGGRVFCDAYTDKGPLYSLLPKAENIAIAGGGSGIGFRLAPGIAEKTLRALGF